MARVCFLLSVVAAVAGFVIGLQRVSTVVDPTPSLAGLSFVSSTAEPPLRFECGSVLQPIDYLDARTTSATADARRLFDRVPADLVADRCTQALQSRATGSALFFAGSSLFMALTVLGVVLWLVGGVLRLVGGLLGVEASGGRSGVARRAGQPVA